jgi:putative membrane protein
MNRLCLTLLTAGGLLTALHGASAAPVPPADRTFMTKAAEGGNAEVALGRLAAARGGSPAVRQFGRRMISDHTKANTDLSRVAMQKAIILPRRIAPEAVPLRARLSHLSGPSFDRVYTAAMIADHEEDVSEFRKEARSGKDPAVSAFAARTLPTLQMHLTMIRRIARHQ